LPPRIPGVHLVPVLDLRFAQLPAEEDLAALHQRMEIDQPGFESLEHDTDLLQLVDMSVDPLREVVQKPVKLAAASSHRLEIVIEMAVLLDELHPLAVGCNDIGHYAPHQRQRLVRLFYCEVSRHRIS
jgi:hypothetical protein